MASRSKTQAAKTKPAATRRAGAASKASKTAAKKAPSKKKPAKKAPAKKAPAKKAAKSNKSTASRARAQAKGTTRVRRGASVLARDDGRDRTSVHTIRARRVELAHELGALIAVATGALVLLALLSHHPGDRLVGQWGEGGEVRNWIGPVGASISDVLVGALGLTAFVQPILLALLAAALWARRNRRLRISEGVGFVGVAASLALGAQLLVPELPFRGATLEGGGALGGVLRDVLQPRISLAGTWIVCITAFAAFTRLAFGMKMLRMAGRMAGPVAGGAKGVVGRAWGLVGEFREGFAQSWEDWQEERALRREEARWEREDRLAALDDHDDWDEDSLRDAVPVGHTLVPDDGQPVAAPVQLDGPARPGTEREWVPAEPGTGSGRKGKKAGRKPARAASGRAPAPSTRAPAASTRAPAASTRTAKPADAGKARDLLRQLTRTADAPTPPPAPAGDRVDSMRLATNRGVVHAEIRANLAGGKGSSASGAPAAPASTRAAAPASTRAAAPATAEAPATESRPQIMKVARREQGLDRVDRVVSARRLLRQTRKPYELPELRLLRPPPEDGGEFDERELQAQAQRLEETLVTYGVKGRVVNILPGPVVTMFEFEPAPGIKVSKIANLGDDLAMVLRAVKVRIVAPIPGKGAVGIEIPSKEREVIFFREVLASTKFRKHKGALPLALGKAVDGQPVVSDMAKFPHILVAGTTGSGKSVCVNTILLSLLFTQTPENLRLILVDPKMLEFSIYDGIPHLLVPVVTSPKKAAVALKWAVEEMTRRYKVLAAMGTRGIKGYNDKVEVLNEEWEAYGKSLKSGEPLPKPDCGRAAGEDTVVFRSRGGDPVGPPDKMPYIVIIIDELADLMMVAKKEVEESIVRLAQMARACGIHMLLATQRPSVDVITGLIKANFPSRLSFRVSSKIDSRTVLDANGAETLLGMGDGLFLPPGTSDLIRVHGAFVADGEVQAVVDHLKEQGEPEYVEAVLVDPEEDGGDAPIEEDFDSMYDEAVAVVAQAGKASTSLLQRRLKLGYNRAARIIDCMERQGVIGPADGARPREVLIGSFD